MFTLTEGNIFESGAEALINTVNCVGVMGKGIALQFKQTYPDVFRAYSAACKLGQIRVGTVQVVNRNTFDSPQFVINFPTKNHWKGKSKYEDIESGLVSLRKELVALKVKSVAIPPLGCGLGGLDWSKVLPLIKSSLSDLDAEILVYAPSDSPRALKVGTKTPDMTAGRAAVLLLMEIYKKLDYRLALIEIQKLAYFLQMCGQPLRLNFKAGTYGPYADNLNHVLQHLEGHYITGTAGGNRAPDAEIDATPEGISRARAFLQNDDETKARASRVEQLIEGFQTPFGMELLGTAHWVCTVGKATSSSIAAQRVAEWSGRKARLFGEFYVELAYNHLKERQWLPEHCR